MQRPVHDNDEFSRKHPKMPREARAKLFMPFDALSGFDEAMDTEAVITFHPAELSEEEKQILDERLQHLIENFKSLPNKKRDRTGMLQISVLYFETDQVQTVLHNDGIRGNYKWLSGDVTDIDNIGRSLTLGGRNLEIKWIYAIEGSYLDDKPDY